MHLAHLKVWWARSKNTYTYTQTTFFTQVLRAVFTIARLCVSACVVCLAVISVACQRSVCLYCTVHIQELNLMMWIKHIRTNTLRHTLFGLAFNTWCTHKISWALSMHFKVSMHAFLSIKHAFVRALRMCVFRKPHQKFKPIWLQNTLF